MAHKMTEEQIERESIEQVFGLTGGELSDKPVTATDASGAEWTFRYSYDGVPEWCGSDYSDRHENGVTYWTAVQDCLHGMPPETIDINGESWSRVAYYQSSGETECPGAGMDEDPFPADECPLCERAVGEEHGYIYIGDGWCEVVYRHSDADDLRTVAAAHNLEIWQADAIEFECQGTCNDTVIATAEAVEANNGGCPHCGEPFTGGTIRRDRWWWWCCSPGCLPESDANGPYDTELEALEAATEGLES